MRSISKTDGQKKRTFIEEARRAQIIEGAIATLAELGYGKASLAEIAKRLGISKGVILYHFESKDALMEQIVIDVYTIGAKLMIPLITAEETATAMLRVYLESNLRFIADNRAAIIAVGEILNNLRHPDGSLRYGVATDGPQLDGIQWILNKGQEDGVFRSFNTWVMAVNIRAAIDRAAIQYQSDPTFDWATYIRETVTMFDIATRAGTVVEEPPASSA